MINKENAENAISEFKKYRDVISADLPLDESGVVYWFRDALETRICMIREIMQDADDSVDGRLVILDIYEELIDLLSECFDNDFQKKYVQHIKHLKERSGFDDEKE